MFTRISNLCSLVFTILLSISNGAEVGDTIHPEGSSTPAVIPSLSPLKVTAQRIRTTTKYQTTVQIIDSMTLANLPGTALDINRALTMMPFATGQFNSVNNDISVRGGHSYENVYIVNGIELDEISHFANMFHSGGLSTYIDPHSIDHIEFDGGAFSAALPPRISSGITLKLTSGNRQQFNRRCNLNVAGVNLAADGPLGKSAGTVHATMRYVDMQLLKKMVPIDGYPKYGDMVCVAEIYPGNDQSLTFTTISGMDLYAEDPAFDADDPEYNYKKRIFQTATGVQYRFSLGEIPFEAVLFGTYRGIAARDSFVDSEFSNPWQYETFDGQLITEKDISPIRWRDGENSTTGGATLNTKLALTSSIEVLAGLSVKGDHLQFTRWYNREKSICTPDGVCSIIIPAQDYEVNVYKGRSGGFVQLSGEKGGVSAVCGLRYDYWHLLHAGGLSPRCGVSLTHPHLGTFSLSGGLIYQEPARFNGLVYDLKIPSGFRFYHPHKGNISAISLQRCTSAAIEYKRVSPRFGLLTLGSYYKWYDREYAYADPMYIDYYYYDHLNGEATFTLHPANGNKYACGLELFYKTPVVGNKFSATLSHTLYTVKNRYTNGKWVDDINNLRNKSDACLQIKINENHALSVRITWHEGRPYTPVSRYNTTNERGFEVPDPDDYFSNRLDHLLLISPRYTCSHRFSRFTLDLFLEPMNVLNTRNVILRQTYSDGYDDLHAAGFAPMFGLQVGF